MIDARGTGASLGRYHLAEPLGGGPTGEVFRAKVYGVAGFERQFAIKKFYPAMTQDPRRAEAIAAAARQYATIEHPRIARMHEYGIASGQTFVAVELVAGVDLAKLIGLTSGAGEPMPPGAALGMIAQVARALGYAHERGVLHLGLCPTNVIATPDGDVKLTDFGFLRARLPEHPGEDESLASRLPYLAPEQLTGAESTAAVDVFQLGALCYELLTGERAFGGKNLVEIAARVLAGAPPDPQLPAPIVRVIRKALASAPAARHPDARQFADALDAAIREAPLPGGRTDVAAAVRRAQARAAEMQAQQMSGAVAFPLPAPPPSIPGVPLADALANEGISSLRDLDAVIVTDEPTRPVIARAAPPPIPGDARAAESPLELPVAIETPRPLEASGLPLPLEAPRPTHPPLPMPAPFAPPDPEAPLGIESGAPPGLLMATVPRRASRAWLWVVLAVVLVAGLGAGGFFGYREWRRRQAKPEVATSEIAPQDRPATRPSPAPAPTPPREPPAPTATPAPTPRGEQPAPTATPAPTPTPPKPAPSNPSSIRLESSPPGAAVYLDGALKGRTPLELPASGDRHKLAVVLVGYKLHRADLDGSAGVVVTLEAAPKLEGPAGIKVRCKSKDRFYVIVDGLDTGMLCPTERIPVKVGEHTVDIFDPVTDATTSRTVVVKDTHNSVRVRVDE